MDPPSIKIDLTLITSVLSQVFVNFAKDQSDDYHSKDNSVRRKEAVINIPLISSNQAADTLSEDKLKESMMWTPVPCHAAAGTLKTGTSTPRKLGLKSASLYSYSIF